jgi:phenylacetate-CoA ligase
MRAFPSLRDRYTGFSGTDLRELPILTKADFQAALADTIGMARGRHYGSLVLGSGGTTSAPKLSLMPSAMFVTELREHWNPLGADDVIVNYDTPGRLCSSHNFFNRLAHESGAVVIPLGTPEDHELGDWLDFAEKLGANSLNATPSHIAHILRFCEETARRPPAVRKLLWTGEPFGETAREITRRMLPGAGLHGVYGSTETWVIGHNGPRCPLDVFHVLPYQHVEIEDGLVLVTTTHPDVINPIVRYRVGDRGTMVTCPCGAPGPAIRVQGRDDAQVKFLSILVSPQEIAASARLPHIRDLQIALIDHGTPAERAELRLLTEPGVAGEKAEELTAQVRARVLREVYRLGYEVAAAPDRFQVKVVPRLSVDTRSRKTPLLVREAGDA